MKRLLPLLVLLGATPALAEPALAEDVVHARIETSMGTIDLALDREAAPVTVANFLEYATSGHYDRLVFHRVIPDVLIQGGGLTPSLYPRATGEPIESESDNGLVNERGTIAMARYDDPDSATSQFFINLADNEDLDRTGDDYDYQAGYTVFGRVVSGLDVAEAISRVARGPGTEASGLTEDVPVEPVLIVRVDPIEPDEVGE